MQPTFRGNLVGRNKGFTLVEVLVIAPIVILVLSAIVALVVSSTGSSLRSSARSQLQYDVLSALDRIEADMKLSKKVVVYSNSLYFASLATDRNPLDGNRKLIHKDSCQPIDDRVSDDIVGHYSTVYWIANGSLERYAKYGTGASLDFSNMNGCENNRSAIFQHPLTREALVGGNGTIASIAFSSSGDGVEVKLTARRQVAGEEVSFTGHLYVESLNVQ